MEEGEPLYAVDGNEIGTATMQSSMEDPQEIEDRTPERASNAPPGRVSRANESRIEAISVLPHSRQHYSQSPEHKNNLSVYPQVNG